MTSSYLLLLCVFATLASNVSAQLQVNVFVRGQPQRSGQKMVVPNNWPSFVSLARQQLEVPTSAYPMIRFYDIEDIEVQNVEELNNNMNIFIGDRRANASCPATRSTA